MEISQLELCIASINASSGAYYQTDIEGRQDENQLFNGASIATELQATDLNRVRMLSAGVCICNRVAFSSGSAVSRMGLSLLMTM
jgi:hypothetical protein